MICNWKEHCPPHSNNIAYIYIPSESDTESASLASSTSILGGLVRDVKDKSVQKPDDDNDSTTSTDALNNIVQSSQRYRADANEDLNVLANDSHIENEENDPLQAMNVALNECIQILDKAATRD